MPPGRLLSSDPIRPIWSSASALVYIGAIVVLLATTTLIGILAEDQGDWAGTGYAAVALIVSLGLAVVLESAGRAVAAGVAVALAVVFVAIASGGLLASLGVLETEIGDYQPTLLVVEALTIGAALAAVRRFRAPLAVLPGAIAFWVAIVDLGSIGSWDDAGAALSIAAGLVLVAAGVAVDRAGLAPYGFWLHALGGLAVGGGVLGLVGGDLGWVLVGVLALGYVALAYAFGRSSYAVLGAAGILITTTYFVLDPLGLIGGIVPFAPPPTAPADGLAGWQIALSYVGAGLAIALLGVLARLRAERAADDAPLSV